MAADAGKGGAALRRDGDALVLTGALDRATVAGLWRQAQPQLAGVRRIELRDVSHVDSAGLALLAEFAAACPGATINGTPTGLDELRAAYRLGPDLTFAG